MNKIIFTSTIVNQNFRFIFLCGTIFKKNDNDKRTVLKKYIESIDNTNVGIILEENFIFRKKPTKDYLNYDKIFLKNLLDIELLMAYLSDKIFIIHESISTAAELGIFASNERLVYKTCLLVPDPINVEEKKISSFINLAFFQQKPSINSIYYYPVTIENKISQKKSDYHTYFLNNNIGPNLGQQISDFIKIEEIVKIDIKLKKALYNKPFKSGISYHFNTKNSLLSIYISIDALKIHVISLFNLPQFIDSIRNIDEIINIVDNIQEIYKEILINTISEIEGIDFNSYDTKLKMLENIKLRQSIGFILYLLQAAKMIELPSQGETITIKNDFRPFYEKYKNLFKTIKGKSTNG